MNIARSVVVVCLAVLALSGCTIASAGPAQTQQPTASASPTVRAATERPALAFDGQCDAIFTTDEVSEILGMDAAAAASNDKEDPFTAQFGAQACQWTAGENGNVNLVIDVVPSAAFDLPTDTSCDHEISLTGALGCGVDDEANGTRISGMLIRLDRDAATGQSQAAEFAALFATKAKSVEAAPVPAALPGQWNTDIHCEAIAPAADFAAAFGTSGEIVSEQGFGQEETYDSPISQAMAERAPLADCSIYPVSTAVVVSFGAVPGARWYEAEVRSIPDAIAVDVPGADTAYLTRTEFTSVLDVFSGSNWIRFFNADDFDHAVASAAISALNALST